MLAVIEQFLAAPFDVPREVMSRIITFASESDAVEVRIDPEITPWVGTPLPMELKSHVLVGFVAGNTASQLRSGRTGDDALAGLEGAISVYRSRKDKSVVSPHLEDLLEIEAKGKLRAHVDEITAKRNERAPAPQ
jgi:hypothetical protein